MMSTRGIYIAIDPGQDGGIAWSDVGSRDGLPPVSGSLKMPDTRADIFDLLFALVMRGEGRAVIHLEKVGQAMPGQGRASLCKFARHCGTLEGLITTLSKMLPLIGTVGLYADRRVIEHQVPPKVWQKKLGQFSPDKTKRKNQIKAVVQARFPGHGVTLSTADALGILAVMLDTDRPGFV